MVLRVQVFSVGAPLLLSLALLCVAQSPSRAESTAATISGTIDDVDSGQPLSNTHIEVQLFPPEHSRRKLLDQFCVPNDAAQPLFAFTFTTDPNGSFRLTAPGGDYLAKVTIPQREPVFGCIFFDTEESVRRCGADPSSLRIHQYLLVRTMKSIPGFSGDMLSSSACAPYQPSPCDPLRVPNRIETKKIVLLNSQGSPIRDARLEFHEYTKGKAKFIASLMTDAAGVADVSSLLETGGLLRMSVDSEYASGEFLIEFAKGGTPGQQTIKFFHWRCMDRVMQGAMVQR
jgi:5-hydroxyisourate hydrolase-like protein (transthyretin family)